MSRRPVTRVAVAVGVALLVASCSTTVNGTAVSVFNDPFSVAGMPAVDGPTGLRPDAEKPSRDVENGDGGEVDELAASVGQRHRGLLGRPQYGETFDGGEFTPGQGADLVGCRRV